MGVGKMNISKESRKLISVLNKFFISKSNKRKFDKELVNSQKFITCVRGGHCDYSPPALGNLATPL